MLPYMRRRGYGQRMHAVFEFQDERGIYAIFSARSGHNAIVGTIGPAVSIAQLLQFRLVHLPIDFVVLVFRKAAGVADALVVEMNRRLRAVRASFELYARRWPLVGDNASPAICDFLRQPVERRQLVRVGREGIGR